MKRRVGIAVVLGLLLVFTARPVPAQDAGGGAGSASGSAPSSFNVRANALPVEIAISAPAALPLDVAAGLAYSGVSLNSQPLIVSEAAPVWVPLLGALGLLGGPGALFGIAAGLGPALVVGAPTLIGLPPLPIDTSLIPLGALVAPLSGLPVPTPPALGCFAYLPGDPSEASCGGPIQDVFGFKAQGASGHTEAEGDPDDPSSLKTKSSASAVGIDPAEGNTLAPFSAGVARSSAFADVKDGRAQGGAVTSLTEIEIAGVLRIPTLDSGITGALGGSKSNASVSERRCSLAGATIGGIPVELRPDGFVIADQATLPLPLSTVTAQLNGLLKQAGIVIGSGPADFGTIQVIPYPGETTQLAEDGTQLDTTFSCLQVHYNIPASGTDVKVTLGKVAMRILAFADEGLGSSDESFDSGAVSDDSSGVLDEGTSLDTSTGDLGGGLSLDTSTTPSQSIGSLPAPKAPTAGSGAPPPSSRSFRREAQAVAAVSWGIDGGWLAPFALLALAVPILAKSRRFSISGGNR